jgi:glyceraldehyde-3-phosphate dehydrogenase (NADP+)
VTKLAPAAAVRAALDASVAAAPAARAMPAHERAAALRHVADALAAQQESFAQELAVEAAKPITQARRELDRALFVFRDAAEEATRINGEMLAADAAPMANGRLALTRRFPLAPITAITPFNFPLLLAAHKIAPAMACGATITLKPPPQDPATTLRLGELIKQSGYPAGGVNVVLCDVDTAQILIEDPRVRMITFTGSARAGWAIRAKAAHKRVTLELGGNAAVIVEPDAELDWAVERSVLGGYAYSGQSCISTQRLFVHRSVYEPFLERFVRRVRALVVGDVLNERTDVGPLISSEAAQRVASWIHEAVAAGAEIATGGGRDGRVVEPTVLVKTTPPMKVNCEEVFGPVVTVSPYENLDDAVRLVNASPYGLQAGVFTTNLKTMFRLFAELDVGAVNGNDMPAYRIDRLPYGGAKASGLGREGVRYAIAEMTESRLLTLRVE